MRTRKGLGPAPRPQPDNSRPSSPAAPPEPRWLTPRLPRSKGIAATGPHAAMPGDAARGHGRLTLFYLCVGVSLLVCVHYEHRSAGGSLAPREL